jgi:hypothetical protein
MRRAGSGILATTDESEWRRWRASLERAAARDGFFSSVDGVTVAGRKP